MMDVSAPSTPDLLGAIVAATRRIVEVRARETSLAEMERRASKAALNPGRLKRALTHAGRINVIAECKRRSPSRGSRDRLRSRRSGRDLRPDRADVLRRLPRSSVCGPRGDEAAASSQGLH